MFTDTKNLYKQLIKSTVKSVVEFKNQVIVT